MHNYAHTHTHRHTHTCAIYLQDYDDKDYNVKKAGYWELGRLGPEMTDELQAKRENQERVKAMAAQVSEGHALYLLVHCVLRNKIVCSHSISHFIR